MTFPTGGHGIGLHLQGAYVFSKGSADCKPCRAAISSLRYYSTKAFELEMFHQIMDNDVLRSSMVMMYRTARARNPRTAIQAVSGVHR